MSKIRLRKVKKQRELDELLEIKQHYVNQKQPFSLFMQFVFKNCFLSITNILFFLFLPIVFSTLAIYLYPFNEVMSTIVIVPPIIIGIVTYSRAIYRYRQQDLFIKRFSNYAMITLFYFLFSLIWSALMFGLFILIAVGHWEKGAVIGYTEVGDKIYSPALISGSDAFIKHINWPGYVFTFFQTILTSMSIGLLIGMITYRKNVLWILIVAICFIVFAGALLTIPSVYYQLPKALKYIALINPLGACFNLSQMDFLSQAVALPTGGFTIVGTYNIFNTNNTFKVFNKNNGNLESFYITNSFTNIYNLLEGFCVSILCAILVFIIVLWNLPRKSNLNKENKLFITLNDLKRSSSFKTLFIGVPDSFKLDGMDDPYKNYVIYVDKKCSNKFVFDILTNKVHPFSNKTIEFNNLKAIFEIQQIIFNDAIFAGVTVANFLEYYKQLNFVRYQEIIKNFNFSRLFKIRLEYLDYDSLFYLYIFAMLFKNKKIILIDDYSLSKISSKVIDVMEKNKLNYWLITNIKN